MRTFTQQLTLRFAGLVTVTTAVVLTIGGWLLDREVMGSIEVLHEGEYEDLRQLIGDQPVMTAGEVARRINRSAENHAALYFIQVHSIGGEILYRSPNLGSNLLPDLSGRELHWTVDLPGIGPVRVSEFHDPLWHVQVASALAPLRRLRGDYVQIAVILMIGVAAASIGLGYAFSRITLQPVRAIEATANRIRFDNLSERIPMAAGGDELASLTRLLNQMFDRLQASFEQVGRFSADVSHEIKTPLALIRLNAEKLRSRLAADPEAVTALGDILEEIARLNQVTDRLLFLAKSESGALKLALKSVSVPALLASLAEDAQVLAADRGVRFVLAPNSPGEIRADPELLRQLLLNLVSNAVSVSAAGGLVTLESAPTETGWSLVVMDEGPGLLPAQREKMFERFVRFEQPASKGGPRAGHGLGLAICKSIVELHGGSIRAQSRPERTGLRVMVELPS